MSAAALFSQVPSPDRPTTAGYRHPGGAGRARIFQRQIVRVRVARSEDAAFWEGQNELRSVEKTERVRDRLRVRS